MELSVMVTAVEVFVMCKSGNQRTVRYQAFSKWVIPIILLHGYHNKGNSPRSTCSQCFNPIYNKIWYLICSFFSVLAYLVFWNFWLHCKMSCNLLSTNFSVMVEWPFFMTRVWSMTRYHRQKTKGCISVSMDPRGLILANLVLLFLKSPLANNTLNVIIWQASGTLLKLTF